MTQAQLLTLLLLGGLVALFLWDRLRYDMVALLALLAGLAAGIVPPDHAFEGFANPVLPLIAASLVLSVAVGQSGVIEILLRYLTPLMRTHELQVGILAACVALLSGFMKNIGALALFIPAAVRVARRNDRSPSEFLMPLGFASLLGGAATLIGTSPNLLISTVRQELGGPPFRMFDFTPVGGGIALFGVAFLAFGWRLLPRRRHPGGDSPVEDYTSELRVLAGSPFAGRTIGDLETLSGGEVAVAGLARDGGRRYLAAPEWRVAADDVLVVEADPQAIERFSRDGKLELVGTEKAPAKEPEKVMQTLAASPAAAPDAAPSEPAGKPALAEAPNPAEPEFSVIEAVVTVGSDLIGRSAAELQLRERYGVNLLAIGRRGRMQRTPLRLVPFRLGDAIVLQAYTARLADILPAIGCLPLAERPLKLGQPRQLLVPLAILAAVIAVSTLTPVPVAIAFVAAAVAVVLLGLVSLKEAYAAIEWPILVLIGALIPIGDAVQHTGTATLVANLLAAIAGFLPDYGVLALLLVVTMLVTPILHHAAAVLVMGPIAASLAQMLGYHVDPFLIAVALGAGCDFLSPVGHQSNTLVMGIGGYRFGDYSRLGLPLSIAVVLLGVPLIMLVWPLH